MSEEHTIELGSLARDRISGWRGVVVARYEYLNGCERYDLAGKDKDGRPESFVFDAQQIDVLAPPGVNSYVEPHEEGPPIGLRKRGGPFGNKPGGPRDNRPVPR